MGRLLFALIYVIYYLDGIFASPLKASYSSFEGTCASQKCHELDFRKINVHLIPHSHDDVGWLKTVEEYYYGKHDTIQNVGVQYIIDSVLQALKRDPRRRYIQVETAFFWKWWNYQSDDKRQLFKSLVENGQIEMVGGGWSMNDEACTNYQSTINQFTWGLRILNDTLGKCGRPKIGWQIDPFGHSREQASIFKQMGFNAFFFVRLSKSTKDERKANKDLEFLWRSSDSLNNSEIFTSIFSTDSYFAPNNFCWDYLQCSSDAINDDIESFDYNLDEKVKEFSAYIANYSTYYRSSNILFAMGGDFQYQAAERNYLNIDRLIKGFKNNPKYNVFYSTPSCYYQAVINSKPDLSTTSDDFFPYTENDHAYWSGYYTSRPTIKRFERTGNNILQASQHLNAFAKMRDQNKSVNYEDNIRSLREIMGIMQHHDAITGTEKQHVAEDYARLLAKSIDETETPLGDIIGNLLRKNDVSEEIKLPLSTCPLTNISICENSIKDQFMVAIYNPLSRYVTHYVRLPSQEATYKISGPDGDEDYDILHHMKYPINYTTPASAAELIFAARNIPPMGINYYYIQKIGNAVVNNNDYSVEADNKTFGTNETNFTLDDKNLLQSVTMNNKKVEISQRFLAYISNNGTGDSIASGAYLFRPINGSDAYNVDYDFLKNQGNETAQNASITYQRGNLVDEVIQVFNDWLTQTIRVYKREENNYIEFDWLVGPLDNNTVDALYNHGKEIITRFYVKDFDNEEFYTDSNGRETIERNRNHYPYKNSDYEPVTSNYYPVTSKIAIQNKSRDLRVALLNDRSQGGSSLWGGEIELMVHRRLLRDDYKGVDEYLQEKQFGKYLVVRGQHYLVLGSLTGDGKDNQEKSIFTQERELALKKLLQPLVFIGDATSQEWSLETIKTKINFKWSGLKISLPDNVNILNLEPWKDDTYLLRLEHIVAKGEDPHYSKEVTVDIGDIFSPFSISFIRETTLAANDWLSDAESLTNSRRKTDGVYAGASIWENPRVANNDDTKISLTPMQIRTFIIEVVK